MEKHFKNALATIGAMSLVYYGYGALFLESNVQKIYIYVLVMMLLLGVVFGGLIGFVHEYYEDSSTMKPHYITLILGVTVAFVSYLLTKTLFNIEISAGIFIVQFLFIFIMIYGLMYLVNKSYMNKLNKIIKDHKF